MSLWHEVTRTDVSTSTYLGTQVAGLAIVKTGMGRRGNRTQSLSAEFPVRVVFNPTRSGGGISPFSSLSVKAKKKNLHLSFLASEHAHIWLRRRGGAKEKRGIKE